MKRLIALAALSAALLLHAAPAPACPPVAPASGVGLGMGYGAPLGLAPAYGAPAALAPAALGAYGMNLNVGLAPAGLGYGYGAAAPLLSSPGFGVGLGGYGASSVGAFGADPVGTPVLNRALIVNGRPGLFQRRLIRRHLRRGF